MATLVTLSSRRLASWDIRSVRERSEFPTAAASPFSLSIVSGLADAVM